MGCSSSKVHVNNIPSDFRYFAIQTSHTYRFRLILPNQFVIKKTKLLLEQFWGKISSSRESPGFIEFQLKKIDSGWNDAQMKIFMCMLIKDYYDIGWHLKASTDLKHYNSDLSDVVIFERKNPKSINVICLSLNGTNLLRVFIVREDVLQLIKSVIVKFWPYGIVNVQKFDKYFEIKLRGNPWSSSSTNEDDSYFAAALINGIFSALYHIGYIYSAAIDSGNREADVTAIYFRYDLDETRKIENMNRQFFAISLNKSDRLRLISVLPDLMQSIKKIMTHLWPNGVENYKEGIGALEFKLNGSPFLSETQMETIESRQLIGNLIHFLSQFNWSFYASCKLSESIEDKSIFFFRYRQAYPIRTSCLSLTDSNKISVIGDNHNLIDTVRTCIKADWKYGVSQELNYFGSWQIELNGDIFANNGSNNGYASLLMLKILDNLESDGLKLLTSSDVNGKYRFKQRKNNNYNLNEVLAIDFDTWYFADKTHFK